MIATLLNSTRADAVAKRANTTPVTSAVNAIPTKLSATTTTFDSVSPGDSTP